MILNTIKPDLNWIANKRVGGDEWITYTKKFHTDTNITSAVVRFECDCTCAVYINGIFAACGNGRTPERVNCHEVTSKLARGENEIKVVLGDAYYQGRGENITNLRGYRFSSFALELCIDGTDGSRILVPTDKTWMADIDGQSVPAMETMLVTEAEYNTMWSNATPWLEPKLHIEPISEAVAEVAGEEYVTYASKEQEIYACPEAVLKTNMIENNGIYTPDESCDEVPYIIYDFGRTVVGYTDLMYTSDSDTEAVLNFDFSESVADFDHDLKNQWTYVIQALVIKQKLSKSESSALNLRRRAFRLLKIEFAKDSKIDFKGVRVQQCLFPATKHGWFSSSDDRLNRMWEIGKYTLQVNKHQEYESCPRNEMVFFTGDGYIDSLIDLYAFGDERLLNTSLSLNHSEACTGITHTSEFNKSRHQWDYYAWRIVCVYTHYKITGDREFAKRQFDLCEKALRWQINRMGKNKLIFQPQCFYSTYTYTLGQVDWACSPARLGDKPYLNSLLYKSLTSMSEIAKDLCEDAKSIEWATLAEEVKTAINDNLWSEEKGAYMDAMDDYVSQDGNIIPIMFGVANKERATKALDTIKDRLWSPYGATILDQYIPHTRGGNTTISPLMCAYEAEARFLQGDADNALELIRRCWGTMMDKGARTFWEFSPNSADGHWDALCHAWSAGCTYLLSAYVLGIRMTEPDFTAIVFEPKPCDLENIKGVVPTSHGYIAASYNKEAKLCRLAVPKNIKTECKLPEGIELEIIKY